MIRPTELNRYESSNKADLRHYFEYSSQGVEVIQEGLQEMPFGEFLVERSAIDRYQLFRALQMQDRNPGVRLGECIAALGFMPYHAVEIHLQDWRGLATIEAVP